MAGSDVSDTVATAFGSGQVLLPQFREEGFVRPNPLSFTRDLSWEEGRLEEEIESNEPTSSKRPTPAPESPPPQPSAAQSPGVPTAQILTKPTIREAATEPATPRPREVPLTDRPNGQPHVLRPQSHGEVAPAPMRRDGPRVVIGTLKIDIVPTSAAVAAPQRARRAASDQPR
jgi:hypothetical protein